MKHATPMRALKPLLLGSAALVIAGLQPAVSQDRSQMPSAQSPAASQPQGGNQPAARENRAQPTQQPRAQERSQKGTTGQSGPAPSGAEQGERATPQRDRAGDAKSPKGDRQQTQSPDRDRKQTRERDTKRDRDQARDRDTDRTRDRDQARDRDTDRTRDRDQARDRDNDRSRDRDQARDNDRRQDRDASRAGERRVTEQQRTRISTSIRQANVRPVRNVNFSVSVGVVVPSTVRFYPVTPAIVEIYPEYRGYEFVVVEDDIVIVEPRSRKIVTVIDDGGSAAVRSRGKLTLTEKQRDVIRRSAVQRRTTGSASTTIEEYEIDDDIPETVEIETFPETVFTEVPEIRGYRYVVRDDDVYVIDPSERRVIEVIR